MTIAVGADMADIRKRGQETQTLVLIVFAVAAVSVVGELVVAPLFQLARGAGSVAIVAGIRDRFVEALPMFFLLSGLWSAHRVFGRVGKGDVFSAANAAGVSEIGQAMGWCGFAECVMTPTLKVWIARAGIFDFQLEGWAMVLAALGGAVILFGPIWALAVEIKTDADQII